MIAMPTEEELKKWAPHANPAYLKAFLDGESRLRDAGILDSALTLCHFLGQSGAETNGWQIIRESLNYKTVSRIRAVWPARTRKYSDGWIKSNLIGKPIAIGDFAYGGRMGNVKGTNDGYNYRGGGFIQTTGKWAVKTYAKSLGFPTEDDALSGMLDDAPTCLAFACEEWKRSDCCKYAERNDLLSVSRLINVGSAQSGIMPNGMGDRKIWFAKAWKIWGNAKPLDQTNTITEKTLKDAGSETISMADYLKVGGGAGAIVSGAAGAAKESGVIESQPLPLSTTEAIDQVKSWSESADVLQAFASSVKALSLVALSNIWVMGLILGIGGYFLAQHIKRRRVADARLGLNVGRLG